tara:strand:+ start:205 stop:423 length:219 start_codon:yes stop_codon:yes gene_type:complete
MKDKQSNVKPKKLAKKYLKNEITLKEVLTKTTKPLIMECKSTLNKGKHLFQMISKDKGVCVFCEHEHNFKKK